MTELPTQLPGQPIVGGRIALSDPDSGALLMYGVCTAVHDDDGGTMVDIRPVRFGWIRYYSHRLYYRVDWWLIRFRRFVTGTKGTA